MMILRKEQRLMLKNKNKKIINQLMGIKSNINKKNHNLYQKMDF